MEVRQLRSTNLLGELSKGLRGWLRPLECLCWLFVELQAFQF
jgi:hypothetical protein